MNDNKLHPRETQRLKALAYFDILDTEPEKEFDDIVSYVKDALNVPIVVLALVDRTRAWFKAKEGVDFSQMDRNTAFSAEAILCDGLMEVSNTQSHQQFCQHPMVTGTPGIKFYAGQPIKTEDDLAIGSLCIFDDKQRVLEAGEKKLLALMAHQAMSLIERRKQKYLLELKAEALNIEKRMLEAISKIQNGFIRGEGNYGLFSEFLGELLLLTNSEYGFIGEVLENKQGQMYLKTHAITDVSWNDETSSWYRENAPDGLEFTNLNTLFGKVMVSGEVLISNNAPVHPNAAGVPHGHPPLTQFVGIPFKVSQQVVGMIGLANRPQGYTNTLVDVLTPVIDTCTSLILAKRNNDEKKIQQQILLEETAENLRLASQFNAIYESLHEGVVEADPDTSTIVDCNSAFAMMLGYNACDLVGRSVNDFSVEKDVFECTIQSLKTAEPGQRVQNFEKNYIHKEGHIVPAFVTVYYVPKSSTTKESLWALVKDLTQVKRDEERRVQEQKMNSLGTLSGGIAHDFNNILGIIMANAEMASLANIDDNLSRRIDAIIEASNRGAELVSRILTFSRKTSYERRAINYKQMVESALVLISNATPSTIQLNTHIEDCGCINANANDISQILMNLISNAVQAIEPLTGIITVTLSKSPDLESAMLTIRDTGVGMDDETAKQIFDPFFTTKHQKNGTGLGLSIVYALIDEMDGRIQLESKLGEGTEFRVELPLIASAEEPVMAADARAAQSQAKHILLIEDEEYLLSVYKEALRMGGHHVSAFNSSEEALAHFSRNHERYDLVITDDEMPDLRGTDLISQIHELQPNLNIFLVTGHVTHSALLLNERGAIKELINKPVSIDELLRLIAAL